MNNPLSDFNIGRMRHRELEADWTRGSEASRAGRSKRLTVTMFTLLGSVGIVILLVAQGMIF